MQRPDGGLSLRSAVTAQQFAYECRHFPRDRASGQHFARPLGQVLDQAAGEKELQKRLVGKAERVFACVDEKRSAKSLQQGRVRRDVAGQFRQQFAPHQFLQFLRRTGRTPRPPQGLGDRFGQARLLSIGKHLLLAPVSLVQPAVQISLVQVRPADGRVRVRAIDRLQDHGQQQRPAR